MTKNTAAAVRMIALNTAAVVTTKGIDAAQWRTNVAVRMGQQYFAGTEVDITETIKTAKWEKPRFEVAEEEIARRTYRLTLVERKGNGQTKSLGDGKIVGMFGKDLTPKQLTDAVNELAGGSPAEQEEDDSIDHGQSLTHNG